MRNLSRVVWSEGMYLGPHHFQAQSRYFEEITQFVSEAIWFCPWGLLGLELSRESLRNGTLLLTHARGIFPDGLAFDMPSSDPAPAPRNIESLFPPTSDSLLIYLGIPVQRSGEANCELTAALSNGNVRYIADEKVVFDEVTGTDEKPVRFGRKNIRLLVENETSGQMNTFPVARVLRNGVGQYVLDEAFIPPVARINSSSALMSLTERLIEILEEKNRAFTGRVIGFDKQVSGVSAQQVSAFWFLHAVNTSTALLRQLHAAGQCHPEELFREYLRLAGALCTFGIDSSPASLPLYDHNDLQRSFTALDDHIRRHLELVVPTNCISIKLHQTDRYLWEGEISDTRMFQNARWFFGIQASAGEADLILQTPQKVKVCSARFVPELVRRALPGMKLNHVSVPPSSLSPKIQMQYFSIDRAGPCWDHLVETRKVGVYVPGDLPNPRLELLALLQA